MSGPTDKNDEEPAWDDLADMLGLGPDEKPTPKPAPAPSPSPARKKAPAPKAEEEESETPFGGDAEEPRHHAHVTEIRMEATRAADADEAPGSEDTVVEDGPDVFDDETPATEAAAGEPKEGEGGRKRRRRRRRKKGGAEAEAPAAAPDEAAGPEEAVEPAGFSEPAEDEDEAAVIVGEAASEFDDDDDEGPPAVADADLEDESAEPLPDWKVMAWTDLIATLYRPQDRG
jgi:hypothetical protein